MHADDQASKDEIRAAAVRELFEEVGILLARHGKRFAREGDSEKVRVLIENTIILVLTVAAFVLFFAFGILWSVGLGHFGPRQLGVFWPTYFMMIYTIVGLWVGAAFVAIGLGITALTLIGYFLVDGATFLLWMAVVNGGGLILGGLWMRRN